MPRFMGFDSQWKLHSALKTFDEDLKRAGDRRPALPNEKVHEKAITLAYREALGKEAIGDVPIGRLVKNMMYYVRNYSMRTLKTKDYAPGGKKYNELLNQPWCTITDDEDSQSDTEWHRSSRPEGVFQSWYSGETRDSDVDDLVEFLYSRPRRGTTQATQSPNPKQPPVTHSRRARRSAEKASNTPFKELAKPSQKQLSDEDDLFVKVASSKRRGNQRRRIVESEESAIEKSPSLEPKPLIPAKRAVKREDSVEEEPYIQLGSPLLSSDKSESKALTPKAGNPFAVQMGREKSPFEWYMGNIGLFPFDELSRAATPGLDFKEELGRLVANVGNGADKPYDIRDLAHYFVLAHASHDKNIIAEDMVQFIRDLERGKLKEMDLYLQKEGLFPAKGSSFVLQGPDRPVMSPQSLVTWFSRNRQDGLNHAGFRALARLVRNQERENYGHYLLGSGPASPKGIVEEREQPLEGMQTSPERDSWGWGSGSQAQTPMAASERWSSGQSEASVRASIEPSPKAPSSEFGESTPIVSDRQGKAMSPYSASLDSASLDSASLDSASPDSVSRVSAASSPEAHRFFSIKRFPQPIHEISEISERLSEHPETPRSKASLHSREMTPESVAETQSIVSTARASSPKLPTKESMERLQDIYYEAVVDTNDQFDLDAWHLPFYNRRRNESGEPVNTDAKPKGFLSARQVQDSLFDEIQADAQ